MRHKFKNTVYMSITKVRATPKRQYKGDSHHGYYRQHKRQLIGCTTKLNN